jgi:hypothetical protein
MVLVANKDAGPHFFNLGAIFPDGKCIDDEDIVGGPSLWADKSRIVRLFTAGQKRALRNGHSATGTLQALHKQQISLAVQEPYDCGRC